MTAAYFYESLTVCGYNTGGILMGENTTIICYNFCLHFLFIPFYYKLQTRNLSLHQTFAH